MTVPESDDKTRASAPRAAPPVGMLSEEAARLLDAVAAKLADYRAAPPVDAAPSEQAGTAGHTCVGWCPICRSADLVRGDRTEVISKLLDTALVVVTTLRSLIPEPVGQAEPAPRRTPASGSSPQPGVERINIR